MHDRRQDQRDDRPESQRGMTTRSRQGSEMSQWDESRGGSGDWQGYVVPYRYYGPGYRGVGYYSVFYQGSDAEGEQPESGEGGRWNESRGGWDQGDQAQMSSSGSGRSSGRGGFAGRGPKGYQRSDERLREEISDRLMANDDLDATDVDVKVRGGEVTLTGAVRDRWMKRLAEDLAEGVMGVKDVMNQIRVQGEQDSGSRSTSGGGGAARSSTRSGTQPMSETEESTPNGKRQPQSTGTR